jgi:PAS domain S-box-containing protein
MFRSELLNFEDKVLKNYFLDSKQAMWIVKHDFKSILEVNNAATQEFGYTKEDISLHHFEEIVQQKEQQKLLQLLENASSAKKEISLITGSGKIAYAETIVSAVHREETLPEHVGGGN